MEIAAHTAQALMKILLFTSYSMNAVSPAQSNNVREAHKIQQGFDSHILLIGD